MEKWKATTDSTGTVDTTWFRIRGIPYEKRLVQNVSKVASFVGLPEEVDVDNLTKFDYARIKIGCRDVRKVPVVVNGMLDFFYYFQFQREVPQEGTTNPTGNKWVRNDRAADDNPSPKIQRKMEGMEEKTQSQQKQNFSWKINQHLWAE